MSWSRAVVSPFARFGDQTRKRSYDNPGRFSAFFGWKRRGDARLVAQTRTIAGGWGVRRTRMCACVCRVCAPVSLARKERAMSQQQQQQQQQDSQDKRVSNDGNGSTASAAQRRANGRNAKR